MITIGTDCSGIEAPIAALTQLGIPFRHLWSCEIDKFARQSIQANYHPETLFHDITSRDHSALPDVDIYVCGFPCQPFSLMGNKNGTNDPRSNIMLHCIKVIQQKLPNIFILENVKNFKFIQQGRPFKYLIQQLENIEEYNVYHDILNTNNYGIPQHRERLFIVGIKKDIQIDDYTAPATLPMRPLDDFMIDKTIHPQMMNNTIKIKLQRISNRTNAICLCDTYTKPFENMSPTLTTGCKYLYHSTYHRYLSCRECLLLQGFTTTFVQSVSNLQMCRQAGNSMSVCVIKELFQKLFDITTFRYFA